MHTYARTHDRFPLLDNLLIEVWGHHKSGRRRLLDRLTTHNLITSAGKDFVADRMAGVSVPVIGWLGIGTGTAAPLVGDTALGTEVFRDILTSIARSSVGVTTFAYYLGTGSANGNTLGEVGLFNAASVGMLFARALISPVIVKNSSKTVTFTWVSTFN